MIYNIGETYIGQWKGGMKNFHGKLVYNNLDQFEGEFMDDKKHG